MIYNIYLNGFWGGFENNTNPVNVKFFIELFKLVYDEYKVFIVDNIYIANILVENTNVINSELKTKNWIHTYLFSGESYIKNNYEEYDCVLYGNRNYKNIINLPLYIPYIISSFNESIITENKLNNINIVPSNEILVVVSNPDGIFRNNFLNELDKYFPNKITYAGKYKNNNKEILSCMYNSNEFITFVSNYKYIITMENSEQDTYITEKIIHGILGNSIPIYWGSKRISDYFNSNRFIEVKSENDIIDVIKKMMNMSNSEWLEIVNNKPFTEYGQEYCLNEIAKNIKNLIYKTTFSNLDNIFIISNKLYEIDRYNRIDKMLKNLNLNDFNYKFICPTYKYTITDEMIIKNLSDRMMVMRNEYPIIKKSELSLILNFKAVIEHIVKSYSDGIFLILESDSFVLPEIKNFNNCIGKIKNKEWSAINLSRGMDINGNYPNVSFNPKDSIADVFYKYRTLEDSQIKLLIDNCIEDLSSPLDNDVRFFRKYSTRCTDSQLFSYKGCCQLLEHFNKNNLYDIPLDYYLSYFFEQDINFKYYWTNIFYFDQESNLGIDISTIK